MTARPGLAAVLFAALLAPAVGAQTAVRGAVADSLTGAPLPGALVTARHASRATTTDRLGRFVLWLDQFPDTLVIAQIGRAAARVALAEAPMGSLRIRLAPSAVTLSDVIVVAPADAARPLEDVGRWQVPLAAARGVPPAIETDVLRSLVLVPGVSFSTPLSARPIVRGYDAGESSMRIDGFEILNLYHIGRIFSAFPADAASQVSVATAPQGSTIGGTLAGTIDITGQVGEVGNVHGGLDLSLASATSWAGGGSEGARWFGSARAVHLGVLSGLAGERIPYDFQDFYANALIFRRGRPAGSVTAFASRDRFADRELGSGMDWSNLLIGGRWQIIDDGAWTITASASGNRFAEDVADIPARYSRIDLRNRFDRVGAGLDAAWQGPASRLAMGFAAGRRTIANRITPRSGDDFLARDDAFRLTELGLYGEWTAAVGRLSLQTGARLDAAGGTRAFQPRARLSLPLARSASLGVALGRTARLYHLVTDPQAEPEIAFYDFWLNAGEGGAPVPIIDHATVDLDLSRGRVAGRVSLFASRARGLVELRPPTDQRAQAIAPFREGRGRSHGVEFQLGLRGEGADAGSVSASYVLSFADRDWGTGWAPWSQDRRHLVRVIGRTQLGSHWLLSATFEAASGAPITPVAGVILVGFPDSAGLGRNVAFPAYVYGPENSRRSAGTARADLGARYAFQGPWKTHMAVGLSVVNAGFGAVAPLRPSAPTFEPGTAPPQGRVRYERLFDLPAVPSLTFRIEF